MRAIKFRAWEESKKKMHYDVSMPCNDEGIDVNPWVPMQFTGLKDKNGKEIYEGDIVHVPEGYGGDLLYKEFIGIVDYDPPVFYINQQESIKKTRKWHGQEYGWDELEIIGNIYENPEQIENNPG